METSVFREILYHSLNADKIYGGELMIDRLILPTPDVAGFEGTGSIDGSNFQIGYYKPLAFISAQTVAVTPRIYTTYSSFIVRDASSNGLAVMGQSNGYAYLEIYDLLNALATPYIKLAYDKSYFINDVLIGTTTPDISRKLRVVGNGYIDILYSDTIYVDNVYADNFTTMSGDFNTYAGYVNSMYAQYLLTDAAGITRLNDFIVTQLARIATNPIDINASEWYNMSIMQDVSTTATPTLAGAVFNNGTVAGDNTTGTLGYYGKIDPNSDYTHSVATIDHAYYLKNYEERVYTDAVMNFLEIYTTVTIKFVVVGKLCTLHIYPNHNTTCIRCASAVGYPQTAYLFLDLSNVKYEKLWQSAAAALDIRHPVDVWTTDYGPDPWSSEAIMPCNRDGRDSGGVFYKGITFGKKTSTMPGLGARPTIGKYTVSAGGYLYLYPQIFTWTTKYVPDA
jgi:hypothetical protein